MLNIDTGYRYNQVPPALHTPDSPDSSSSIFDCEHRGGSTSSICSGNTSPVENSSFFENEETKPTHHEYENALLKIELAELQTRLRALQQEKEDVVYKLSKITTINTIAINNEEQIRELKQEKNQLRKQNDVLKKYNRLANSKVKSMQLNLNSAGNADKKKRSVNCLPLNNRDPITDLNYLKELTNINNKAGFRGSYYQAQERYRKIQECDRKFKYSEELCDSLSEITEVQATPYLDEFDVAKKQKKKPKRELLNREKLQNQGFFASDGSPENENVSDAVQTQANSSKEVKTPESQVVDQFTVRFSAKHKTLKHCIFKLDIMDREALKDTTEILKQCCAKYCKRFGYSSDVLVFKNLQGGILDITEGYHVSNGEKIYVSCR